MANLAPAVPDSNEEILVASNIDGELYGLDPSTGNILWKMASGLSTVTMEHMEGVSSYLLDPTKDGKIFIRFDDNSVEELPFNVKQLVEMSPIRTADGTIYLGSKRTRILALNPLRGNLIDIIDTNEHAAKGSLKFDSPVLYLANTIYNVLVYKNSPINGLLTKRWNVTFSFFHSPDFVSDVHDAGKYIPGVDGSLHRWNHLTKSVDWSVGLNAISVSLFSVHKVRNDGYRAVPQQSDLPTSIRLPDMRTYFTGINGHPSLLFESKNYYNSYESQLTLSDSDPITMCIPITHLVVSPSHSGNTLTLPETQFPLIDPPRQITSHHSFSWYSLMISILVVSLSLLYFLRRCLSTPTLARSGKKKKKKKDKVDVPRDICVSDVIIGYGSNGTIVYKGESHGRKVAVKRIVSDFYDLADNEISHLIHSDRHPNVVRYFAIERTAKFVFLALELCEGSLYDTFCTESPLYKSTDLSHVRECMSRIQMLNDILLGLSHLHRLKIIHRDIKPHNVLINSSAGHYRLVISDFGLCKRLEQHQNSLFLSGNTLAGSIGWRAPEVISTTENITDDFDAKKQQLKITNSMDIFAAGLVGYFVLSGGLHVFGSDHIIREARIRDVDVIDEYQLAKKDKLAADMIFSMLAFDPRSRPPTIKLLRHPFFWDATKRLNFIQDFSDRIEVEERDSCLVKELIEILKSDIDPVHGWTQKLHPGLFDTTGKYRKYNTLSGTDLLRFIRNKKNHFNELSEEIQSVIGPPPESFLNYFCDRFPNLLISLYRFAHIYFRTESGFTLYFE